MKTRRKKSVDQQLKAYSTTAEAMLSRVNSHKPGKSWLAYTAAAGAALAMAPSADAAPIYSGPQNIGITTNGSALLHTNLDLDGDSVVDFRLHLSRSTNYGVFSGSAQLDPVGSYNRILAASANGHYAKNSQPAQ